MNASISDISSIGRYLAGFSTLAALALSSGGADAASQATFAMNRSTGLPAACAPGAKATVKVQTVGFAEKMTVTVSGLKPNTALDLFAIQVPNFPFGLGWYVGDLQTGYDGKVTKTFISRFNVETFAVAIGEAPAPVKHPGDANKNPTFKPIHTFHLGAWFNSPADAAKNGCATVVTPFNGEHNAGIQVLSTNGFADLKGPLSKID